MFKVRERQKESAETDYNHEVRSQGMEGAWPRLEIIDCKCC